MTYKTHRNNHDFQIINFIIGACNTPDAAYSQLCDLQEDRSNAIKLYLANKLRDQAKLVRAKRALSSPDEAVRLEAEADIAEIEAVAETSEKCYNAALAELATIEKCMERLEPLRKYKHLPLEQAHEAAQCEEWRLELIRRAENHLLTSGQIPADQFDAMRMHPEFKTSILPAVKHIESCIASGNVDAIINNSQKPLALEFSDILAIENSQQ